LERTLLFEKLPGLAVGKTSGSFFVASMKVMPST